MPNFQQGDEEFTSGHMSSSGYTHRESICLRRIQPLEHQSLGRGKRQLSHQGRRRADNGHRVRVRRLENKGEKHGTFKEQQV